MSFLISYFCDALPVFTLTSILEYCGDHGGNMLGFLAVLSSGFPGVPPRIRKNMFLQKLGVGSKFWESHSARIYGFPRFGLRIFPRLPPRIGEHLNLQKLGVKSIFRKSEFAKTGAFLRFVQWLFPRVPLGWGAMCLCNDLLLQNRVLLPFMMDTTRKFRHRDSNPGRSGESRVS